MFVQDVPGLGDSRIEQPMETQSTPGKNLEQRYSCVVGLLLVSISKIKFMLLIRRPLIYTYTYLGKVRFTPLNYRKNLIFNLKLQNRIR